MDIEGENPNAGEAPVSEIPVAPEGVQQLVNNNFYGPVGNVAQHSSEFHQAATMNVSELRNIADSVEEHLVSRVRDSLTKSRHAGKDLVSGFVPDEWLGCLVADRKVLTDRRLERSRAAMRAPFDLLLGERREPPFDEIEPGGAGGREVHVKARMPSEPSPDLCRLVRAVVVQKE